MNDVLVRWIDQFQSRKILVIGDMVADVYWEAVTSRISREAPVLILEHVTEQVVPGGAANAVHNTATLGGTVFAVGVIGQDGPGQDLKRCLATKQVNTDGLIPCDNRPTITKTRIMAGGHATVRQQVVRIDREKKEPLTADTEKAVVAYITKHLASMDAVVISDYGSYTVSPAILRCVIDLCNENNIPCMVDSRYHIMNYKGVTIVKQNESEAAAAVGVKKLDEKSLFIAGKKILEQLGAKAVLISQGPDGMTLFEVGDCITHIPVTNKSEVYDVTGAGDTVVSAMILAVAAGASYIDAARIANFAAGVVVRKPGTATTNPAELREAIGEHHENSR